MMKQGAKRSALSDSNPMDSTLRSKRVMDAPSFDVHRATSSRQHLVEGFPLDVKRAESSRQHVRALNNQFASWIQLQMQNHPDELWEDGVKDYLSHASNIMEKFKDVVDWLRANSAKSESATTVVSDHGILATGNLATVSEISRRSLTSELNNGSGREFRFSGFQSSGTSTSQSSGLFSMSQTSAKSSDLQNSLLPSTQNSGPFSFNQKQPDSSSQSFGFSGPQSTGFFGVSQMSASSGMPTSGLFSSQASGAFGCGQTLNSSNLPSSGLSSSQRSGFFDSKTGTSSGSQSSSLFNTSQTGASSGSQSSGFFTNSQTPAFSGIQSFATQKVEESGEADEENELEQPTSPSLKKTEEKGIIVVHETKCKVYVKPDDPEDKSWKDMGMGQLSIKCKEGIEKTAKESKPTIIIRNDVGKILLNALIYPGIKMSIKKNTIVSIFHTSGSEQNGIEASVARTYLLRLRNDEETNMLASTIQDYAPSA